MQKNNKKHALFRTCLDNQSCLQLSIHIQGCSPIVDMHNII